MQPFFAFFDRPFTRIVCTGILLVLAIVAFGNMSAHLFEGDDFEYVKEIAAARQNLSQLFSHERTLPGRPAVDLVFFIIHAIGGEHPAPFHIAVVCLHLLAAMLLSHTFQKLGADRELSLLSTGLFLVNVASFRAVHWIACLAYPLSLLFSLITIMAFLHHLRNNSTGWLALATGALGLSILSHMAAAWVVGLCMYLVYQHRKNFRDMARSIAPLWFVTLILGLWVYHLSSSAPQAEHAAVLSAQIHIGDSLTKWIWFAGRLFTTPFVLGTDLTEMQTADWIVGIGFVVVAGTMAFKAPRPVVFWIVWTLLLLTAFIFNPHQTWLAGGPSRYLYLPSAGAALLIVWSLRAICQRFPNGRIPKLLFGCVYSAILIVNILSIKRAEAITYYLSGRGYIARSDWETGMDQIAHAIRHDASIIPLDAYRRYAMGCLGLGQSPDKLVALAPAEKRADPIVQLYLDLSMYIENAQTAWADIDANIKQNYEQTHDKIEYQKNAALAYNNLATHYYYESQFDKSRHLYRKAVEWRPDYQLSLERLLLTYYAQGKYQEAARALQIIIDAKSIDQRALKSLGLMLYHTGHREEALQVHRFLSEQSKKTER